MMMGMAGMAQQTRPQLQPQNTQGAGMVGALPHPAAAPVAPAQGQGMAVLARQPQAAPAPPIQGPGIAGAVPRPGQVHSQAVFNTNQPTNNQGGAVGTYGGSSNGQAGQGGFQPVGPGNDDSPSGGNSFGNPGTANGAWTNPSQQAPIASAAPTNAPAGGAAPPAGGIASAGGPPSVTPGVLNTPSANIGTGSPYAQFGGVAGGANQTAATYDAQAQAALGQQAAGTGATLGAIGLMGQTAMGGGAAQAAAAATNAQGTSNAINAGMALANSSRGGGPAGAAAQAAAQQNAGGAIQTGAMNAAQTQAQMAANAQGGYAQGMLGEQSVQQAQFAQDQQAAQNWTSQGNGILNAQLAADTNVYSSNLGMYENQQNISAGQQNAAIGAVAGGFGGIAGATSSAFKGSTSQNAGSDNNNSDDQSNSSGTDNSSGESSDDPESW